MENNITARELYDYIWQAFMPVIISMGMGNYGPLPDETGLEIAGAIGTVMDNAIKYMKEGNDLQAGSSDPVQ